MTDTCSSYFVHTSVRLISYNFINYLNKMLMVDSKNEMSIVGVMHQVESAFIEILFGSPVNQIKHGTRTAKRSCINKVYSIEH